MLAFMGRSFMVIGILVLVGLGLNVSNQGINQLTLTERPPVVGVSWQKESLQVAWQGNYYEFSRDMLPYYKSDQAAASESERQGWWQQGMDYVKKIKSIFYTIFL